MLSRRSRCKIFFLCLELVDSPLTFGKIPSSLLSLYSGQSGNGLDEELLGIASDTLFAAYALFAGLAGFGSKSLVSRYVTCTSAYNPSFRNEGYTADNLTFCAAT